MVQKSLPGAHSWREAFDSSSAGIKYYEKIAEIVHAKVHTDSPQQPSAFIRFKYMFEYFMLYFIKEKGFYVYRLVALIIVGVFVGTLFLNLSPNTQNINSYVGALFFAVIAMMMTAVSACALFAKDRYEAVDRVKNGNMSCP